MAFDSSGLTLILQAGPVNFWCYDTTDATGVVDGTDYFAGMSAGATASRGMNVGDMVLVRIWTTSVPTSTSGKNGVNPADAAWHIVRAVDSDGNATLAAETAIVVAAGA